MNRSALLSAVAGTLACVSMAQAQWTPAGSPFAGPYTTTAVGEYHSIDLGAASAPAGNYGRISVTAQWSEGGGLDPQWQSDQRIALTASTVEGATVLTGGGTLYLAATAPQGALNSAAAGTLTWNNVNLGTQFVADGVNTLFLNLRNSYTFADASSTWSNVTVTLSPPPAPLVCGATESEPNDSKALSGTFVSTVGTSMCGTSTGSGLSGGGLSTADYYKITTAAHPGIVRRSLIIESLGTLPTLTLRGTDQTAAVINPALDSTLQTASVLAGNTRVVWYTFGNDTSADARSIYARVAGSTSSTSQYRLTVNSADAVVPADLVRSITPGSVTISTVGQTGATQTDTTLVVLDSNYNIIANFSNEDEPLPGTTLGSKLTRTFAAGTYYLAVTRYNTAISTPAASDDQYKSSETTDFPGVMVSSSTSVNTNISFQITDGTGAFVTSATAAGNFDIKFYKMVVGSTTVAGCNPADIACDDGTPLAAAPGCTNSTTGPNEGDYNAFFAADGFFFQSGQGPAGVGGTCDIACDDGTALSAAPGCTNNGVNEGDYNCFFNNLFLPCI
ncbi:MAG: hypothetical protein IBJ18_01765 [Phycisphaerales bacterium]|nr:hypothetical protein [Phycisphaerales bacterium]